MLKPSDDLEMIVCAAHISGCMECEGLINTDTDMELMYFLVNTYNEYCQDYELDVSFAEYAQRRLFERFATEEYRKDQ